MIGEKNTVTFTVGPERLASHMGSGDLDVLATPAMIAEMERAACTLLARFLEPGQTSVGTAMDVSHMSATPSGMAAEASAEIVAAEGRRVDFKNTVIVMTSNIGARSLTAMGSKLGFSAEERDSDPDAEKKFETAREQVMAELRQTFRPEFLNRIDDIIVFRPLTEEDIREVARRMLKTVSTRMETMGIHLDASDEAVAELAKEGFDPKYGARPLRRAIQSKVEDAVAEKMLDGTLKAGDTAKLTVENNRLCVSK